MVKLGRNPFSRETIRKEKMKPASCSFCGGTDARGNIYQIVVESDSVYLNKSYYTGLFCSMNCFRMYHNT
jgi:hypothetical protein